MEAELKEKYPDSTIRLIESGGGVFDVTCDGKVVFSKQQVDGQRFPQDGEIARLIQKK